MTRDFGARPELAWLPVTKLFVDRRYQRGMDSKRSQKLIERINRRHPDRWRVRFSDGPAPHPRTVTIDSPDEAGEAIVCPAQTGETALRHLRLESYQNAARAKSD